MRILNNMKNNRKFNNVKEMYDKFTQLESEHNLISLEIAGVKIWQILRYELFFKLTEEEFKLGAPQVTSSLFEKINSIPRMIYNAFFNNGWFEGKCSKLVFPHSRVQLVDNQYIDINTKYFIDQMKECDASFLVFEKPHAHKHYTKKVNYIKYLDDAVLFNNIISKFVYIDMTEHEIIINKVKNEINEIFKVDIDLNLIFLQKIKKFKSYYYYYYKLLKKISPDQIFIVVSYFEPWLIAAAKDLGIKVTEFQHGAFSKYHLGYSYCIKDDLKYLPDEFLVWNQYWKDIIPFPISDDNVVIYPSKFQALQKEKYKNESKIKNQVIILSQGTISNKMAKIILDNFKYFSNFKIVYKLHPAEYQRYKSYNNLMELLKKDNVELVVNGDLYKLFATSEYQVGVYSTTLFEGLEFGLKTILCDLPYIEFMDDLVKTGKVQRILYEASVL